VPSFVFIRLNVWPQYTNVTDRQTDNGPIAWSEPFYKRSPKNVACSHFAQELISCRDGRPFGHNRYGPKSGGAAVPLFPGGGARSPSNTMWPELRPIPPYQLAS